MVFVLKYNDPRESLLSKHATEAVAVIPVYTLFQIWVFNRYALKSFSYSEL